MTSFTAKIPGISLIFCLFLTGCSSDSASGDDASGGGSSGAATGGTAPTGGTAGSAGMATGGSGGGTIFPTPMGELFRDDFEGGSTNWMVTQGTCSIQADETSVFTCELGTNEARAVAGDIWGEYSVQARVRINELDPAGGRRIYLAGRFTDSNNWYGAAIYDGGPFEVQIRKKSAGTSSDIVRGTYPIELGTWYTIKLEMKGQTLNLFMNDTLQLTATDAEFSMGRIALLVDRTSVSWDDVIVTNP
jgi:hypothetical protein